MRSASFVGCKLALLDGERVLVYTRDDRPDIPFPGLLDLPGGGREGNESPEDCVLRELEEEFGLRLAPGRLLHREHYPLPYRDGHAYFFVAVLEDGDVAGIRFGSEGSAWALMPIDDYLAHHAAIPHLQQRLRDYLMAR